MPRRAASAATSTAASPAALRAAPRRRPATRSHHGDLRRALVDEALRTIERDGVAGLTLRAVGSRLRVSRTALYRHFADKSALLAAVARDGFVMLRQDLVAAYAAAGGGTAGFEAMGLAYIGFALAHPSHYRVMFGAAARPVAGDEDLARESQAAFQVLLDAIVSLQQDRLIRDDDPLSLAQYVWSVVHGVASLAIDGVLHCSDAEVQTLAGFAVGRIRSGIA